LLKATSFTDHIRLAAASSLQDSNSPWKTYQNYMFWISDMVKPPFRPLKSLLFGFSVHVGPPHSSLETHRWLLTSLLAELFVHLVDLCGESKSNIWDIKSFIIPWIKLNIGFIYIHNIELFSIIQIISKYPWWDINPYGSSRTFL
jgi:hypothetical protein